MLPITTHRQRFTYVGPIPQPWLPTVLRLTVATLPHGLVTRRSSGGHVVPDASHPGVTHDARPGRVPVAEHRIFMFPDQYTCDLVSHVRGRRRARTDFRSGAGVCFPEPAEKICKGIRHAVQPFVGVRRSQHRACDGVAKRTDAGRTGAQQGCRHCASPVGSRSPRQVSRALTRHSGEALGISLLLEGADEVVRIPTQVRCPLAVCLDGLLKPHI